MTNDKQQMILFKAVAMLLILPVASIGIAAQNGDNLEEPAPLNTPARWQLPSRNLSPTPVIQRMSYNPVHAPRLNRPAVQDTDEERISNLQWNQMKMLFPGARLVVENRYGDWAKGRFVAIDGEKLTLQRDGAYMDFERASIRRIKLRGKRMTGTGARRGFLATAIGVGTVGGIACIANDRGGFCGLIVVLGGLFYGGLGAAVGAGVGSAFREKTVIYEAHSPELLESPKSPARGVSRNPRTAPLSDQVGPGTPCLAASRQRQSASTLCNPLPGRSDNTFLANTSPPVASDGVSDGRTK